MLESLLPVDRPGYRPYREAIANGIVLAEGRGGPGDLLIGPTGLLPDTEAPVLPAVACGAIETTRDTYSITVREFCCSQIEAEILSSGGEPLPDLFEEKRRWTCSTWLPGQPSPVSGTPVREVSLPGGHVLALLLADHRIIVYDATDGMIHLVPATALHHELLSLRGMRSVEDVQHISFMFESGAGIPDVELQQAFLRLNIRRPRVRVPPEIHPPAPTGWRSRLRRFTGR